MTASQPIDATASEGSVSAKDREVLRLFEIARGLRREQEAFDKRFDDLRAAGGDDADFEELESEEGLLCRRIDVTEDRIALIRAESLEGMRAKADLLRWHIEEGGLLGVLNPLSSNTRLLKSLIGDLIGRRIKEPSCDPAQETISDHAELKTTAAAIRYHRALVKRINDDHSARDTPDGWWKEAHAAGRALLRTTPAGAGGLHEFVAYVRKEHNNDELHLDEDMLEDFLATVERASQELAGKPLSAPPVPVAR